jgi:hypothetical protein
MSTTDQHGGQIIPPVDVSYCITITEIFSAEVTDLKIPRGQLRFSTFSQEYYGSEAVYTFWERTASGR